MKDGVGGEDLGQLVDDDVVGGEGGLLLVVGHVLLAPVKRRQNWKTRKVGNHYKISTYSLKVDDE